MHLETLLLDLMASEYAKQSVLTKKLLDGLLTEVVGAVALRVFLEITMDSLFVVHRVSPHKIAKDAIEGDLLLSLDLVDLIKLLEVR